MLLLQSFSKITSKLFQQKADVNRSYRICQDQVKLILNYFIWKHFHILQNANIEISLLFLVVSFEVRCTCLTSSLKINASSKELKINYESGTPATNTLGVFYRSVYIYFVSADGHKRRKLILFCLLAITATSHIMKVPENHFEMNCEMFLFRNLGYSMCYVRSVC